MKATQDQIKRYLIMLGDTPRRIRNATAGLDDETLHRPVFKGTWSAADILAHVRSCADIWMFSIYAMLAEGEPALALIDPRRWAKATSYSSLIFVDSLQSFSLQRLELLRKLKNLPFDSWSRSADIGGRKHTVFTQTRRMALHEEEHSDQIESVLNSLLEVM